MQTPLTIVTPRLVVREVRMTDDGAILAAMACPEIDAMHSHGLRDGTDVRSYIGVLAEEYRGGKLRTLAIADNVTDTLYGAITIDRHKLFPRAELGYWIAIPHRNRGYATEAVKAIIDYGFSTWPLRRIQATHDILNPASGRVLAKAGMRAEGVLRYYYANSDAVMYAVTASDLAGDPRD